MDVDVAIKQSSSSLSYRAHVTRNLDFNWTVFENGRLPEIRYNNSAVGIRFNGFEIRFRRQKGILKAVTVTVNMRQFDC